MTKIDQSKLDALQQSVYDLVRSEGIVNLSMGKVAKAAGISPRTIYIYYDDKADLLGQLYLQAQQRIDSGLMTELGNTTDLLQQLAIMIRHYAKAYTQMPNETVYTKAIEQNPQLVSAVVKKHVGEIAPPVQEMYENMQADNHFLHAPFQTFMAIAAGPMSMMIQDAINEKRAIKEQEINDIIAATSMAITV
ncbi:TetR/AcrR family transcriptional regulator [Furfurilactobacillus siliginis]|nr:TetR/AcrR family transcriptional regulator [Furfurilactobacillus siliginis]